MKGKSTRNPAKSPALVPGPRGGQLYVGGVPGNKGGGRLPSEIRQGARQLLTIEFLESIAAIGRGEKIPRTIQTPGGRVKHVEAHPTPQSQVQAAQFLANLGVTRDYTILIDDYVLIKALLKVAVKYIPKDGWPAFTAEIEDVIKRHADVGDEEMTHPKSREIL